MTHKDIGWIIHKVEYGKDAGLSHFLESFKSKVSLLIERKVMLGMEEWVFE